MSLQKDAQRSSEVEVISSRVIHGPPRRVFEAWSKADLFRRWWVPEAAPMKLVACEMDVRPGGTYRLVFEMNGQNAEFFGTYLEVTPDRRLVWTNEEAGGTATVTTVDFAEVDHGTLVTVRDRYPKKEALDAAMADGSCAALPGQLAQLDRLVGKV